jgi:hypothetical protein
MLLPLAALATQSPTTCSLYLPPFSFYYISTLQKKCRLAGGCEAVPASVNMNKVFPVACIACKNGVIDKYALLLHSNFTLCNIWKLTMHGSAVITSDIVLAAILVLTH